MKNKSIIKNIGLFLVILFFIASIILSRDVNNLDEIWNFNFARCIANGLVPYKDFNIIQGPFFPWACSIFFKIFGQEMLVNRFLAIILDTTILFIIYIIMSKLKIKEFIKYLVLILFAIIMKPYFTIDYNWLILLILLFIIKLEIKQENSLKEIKHESLLKLNIKRDLLIGLFAGIAITTKQTTGLLISICVIGYKILEIRKKEDFIEFVKIAFVRLIGCIIPVLIMVLILIYNQALNSYIDYCILGISTFSNKISYIESLIKNKNIIIKILSLLPVVNIVSFIIYIKNKDKNLLILFCYSIVNLSVVYPISDETHFVIAIVPTVISFAYLINKIKINKNIEIWLKYFLRCIICMASVGCILYFGVKIRSQNLNTELEHFKYLPMSNEDISGIKEITNYIENRDKKVYILDATAALYMIPINRYNKNFDMFLNGNLGSKGEKGQIENLENEKQKIILIKNNKYSRNWQNPENVRKYVKTHMMKTGEIGVFDIYE